MSSSKKKDTVRGKRYTPEEKTKVVSFVADYNASNGRGGQSAAAKKFGISQLTISNWLKSSGLGSVKKSQAKGGIQNKLTAMLAIGQDIEKLEKEIATKRKEFEALKASL